MEGSVLSFLKAEWKVSDTVSAHWASSFMFIKLRWEMIVCFNDNGGVVDHHSLKFLFIIISIG